MSVGVRESDYIRWQNRAFRFYLASRVLAHNGLPGPMAFCAQQAIELLLKATLVYWDRSFQPTVAGHKFRTMIRTVGNKVPNGKGVLIPAYFFEDQRFLRVTRYPSPGRGVPIPHTLIVDLDRAFADFVALVPFQFNSDLIAAVKGSDQRS
ncbi:MAG TPA: HEPN domain-containing protein, partial [Nitrospirales bacterium]|nr:HEPN domain-containing protein [Nitrospirales bacterium]